MCSFFSNLNGLFLTLGSCLLLGLVGCEGLQKRSLDLEESFEVLKTSPDSAVRESAGYLQAEMLNKFSYVSLPFCDEGVQIHEVLGRFPREEAAEILKGHTVAHIRERSVVYFDSDTLTGNSIEEVIEYAHKAWLLPYAKQVSQEDFQRFILPYRFLTEPFSDFKQYFYEYFSEQLSAIYQTDSIEGVMDFLLAYCEDSFHYEPFYEVYMDGQQSVRGIIDSGMGDEVDRVTFYAAVFSSVGFPVSIMESFDQKWCAVKVGEEWKYLMFSPEAGLSLQEYLPQDLMYVGQLTFGRPKKHITNQLSDIYQLPHMLSRNVKNVTDNFTQVFNHKFDLGSEGASRVVFVATLMRNKWEFFHWESSDDQGAVQIGQLRPGCIYAICDFQYGDLTWPKWGKTFYLDANGNVKLIGTGQISEELQGQSARSARKLINDLLNTKKLNPEYLSFSYFDDGGWHEVLRDSSGANSWLDTMAISSDVLYVIKQFEDNWNLNSKAFIIGSDYSGFWDLP